MARDAELIEKRNKEILERYLKMKNEKALNNRPKYRIDYIYSTIGAEYFLTPGTIEHIILDMLNANQKLF